jgi:hypothetical protein
MRGLWPVAILLLLISGACLGPIGQPMAARPRDDQQKQVDTSWDNMLSRPDRLDRQLLLDVITSNQLHHFGVDRLTLRSEKAVRGGKVVMEVNYDRMHPEQDEFVVRCLDSKGMETRRERYSRHDVESSVKKLIGPGPVDESDSKLGPQDRKELERLRFEHDGLMRRIEAATQPSSS